MVNLLRCHPWIGGGLTSVGAGSLSKKDIDLRSLASLKGVINERPLTEMAAQGESPAKPCHFL